MPNIDDPLAVELDRYEHDAGEQLPDAVLKSLFCGALSLIPFGAGAAIQEIIAARARQRFQERLKTLSDRMSERLKELTEGKVDTSYFQTDEFQTILFLLFEKLHTTHDKRKLRAFGNALANAAIPDFKDDDREAFVRVLRELSEVDLRTLNEAALRGWTPHVADTISYPAEVLTSLYRLQSLGLVLQSFRIRRPSQLETRLKSAI